MQFVFLVDHLYYLPQFLPVAAELRDRGAQVSLLMRGETSDWGSALTELEDSGHRVECSTEPDRVLRERAPEWAVFGNRFDEIDDLAPGTRTALLYHGIGVKEVYYSVSKCAMDVRFVEGPLRRVELEKRYPDARFVEVGFAKLDCFFGAKEERPALDIEGLGLDPKLPIVLYAPTFYPSSLELMPDDLPQRLEGVNLIVKGHEFSWKKKRYAHQRKLLNRWALQDSVHVAPPSSGDIRPFMGVADLLISEASSVLFEFAALDRPIVWCDFLKLRWTYRGPLSFRIKSRMDPQMARWQAIAAHAAEPDELAAIVRQELDSPERHRDQRAEATQELIGQTDGRSAQRVADFLLA